MSLRPTVIGSGPAPAGPAEAPASALQPTVIPTAIPTAPAPAPAVAAPAPAPATTATPSVTKVSGTERKGLAVELAALRQAQPQASDAALEHAVALLAGVVPQTFQLKGVEALGRSAQEGVARLVDRVLRLVDQESTRTTGRHVERLQELLGELAEVLQPAALSWRRRSLRQALAEQRPELDSLRSHLQHAEASLVEQRDRLQAMQAELQQTQDGLQGALVAVTELRPRFDDDRRLGALDRREAELAKSLALVQAHALQMQQLEADYGQMAHRIRDTVLHALPAWLSLAATMPDEALNDTERYRLLDPLQALILGLSRPHR
ncbi:MAG: hypothetical protein U1F53_19210 [Burkholderiaceae bacterium]